MASGLTFTQTKPVQFTDDQYSAVRLLIPSYVSYHQLTLCVQPSTEQDYQDSNGCPFGYLPAEHFGPDGQLDASSYPGAYMQDNTSGYSNMGKQGYSSVSSQMGPKQADATSIDQGLDQSELRFYAGLVREMAEMNGTRQGSSCIPGPQSPTAMPVQLAAEPQASANVPGPQGFVAMPNERVAGPEDQDDLQLWDGGVSEWKAIGAHFHPTSTVQYANIVSGLQVPDPTNYMAVEPLINTEAMGQDSSPPTPAFIRDWKARVEAHVARQKSKERNCLRKLLRSRRSAGVGTMVNGRAFTDMSSGMGPGLQTGTNYMGQGFNTPGHFTDMPTGVAGEASITGHGVNPQPSPTCVFQNHTPGNVNRTPPQQNLPSPNRKRAASTTFVMEDPSSPLEKRARFSSDEDEQKARKEQRLMKEAGGSCLWCYRNKKKCGPMSPCSNCESNGFQCIRDAAQLSLSSASNATGSTTGNEQTVDIFRQLRDTAMRSPPQANIDVKFRQPRTGSVAFWSASLPRVEPFSPGYVNEQLVSALLGLVQSPRLGWIENETAQHPLVLSASAMFRLLSIIKSLLRGQVYVRPAETDAGRITALYILTACIQSLRERSQAFSSKLCEAVRHKNKPGFDSRNPTKKPLNPEWVATGLYYRVIDGLRTMQPLPFLEKALGDVSHLHNHPANVWSVLHWLPVFTGKLNSKIEVHGIFHEHIPVLEEQWPLDVALLPGNNANGQQLPPTVMQRVAEPFWGSSYNMETFLDDNFSFLPAVTTPTPPTTTTSNGNTNQVSVPDLDWDSFLDFEGFQSSEPSESQFSEPSTETLVGSQDNVLVVQDGLR